MNKRTPTREVRSTVAPQRFEIRRDADGSRIISGYFATFLTLSNDMGGWFERIQPGAFSRSLKNNPDVLCFYSHDERLILGRVSSGTLSVNEDSKGLRFSVKLPDTSYAADLVALMERGDVSSCSFGFTAGKDSWAEEDGKLIRTLEQVTLWEGSIVGMPAYPNTVADLRSCPAAFRSRLKRDDDGEDDSQCDPDSPDYDPRNPDCDDDDDEDRCACRCARCLDGNCDDCTDEDCDDDDCEACPMQDESRADSIRIRKLFESRRKVLTQ